MSGQNLILLVAHVLVLSNPVVAEEALAKARTLVANSKELLAEGSLDEALAALQKAAEAVHDKKVAEPSWLTQALREALAAIEASPSPKATEWLWSIGETSLLEDKGDGVPAERFLRAALEAEARISAEAGLAAAKRLQKLEPVGRPLEVEADLMLAAARVTACTGKGNQAERWLDAIEAGDGPVAAYLLAESKLIAAKIGTSGSEKKFLSAAREAIDAFRALQNEVLIERAKTELIAAAESAGFAQAPAAITEAAAEPLENPATGGSKATSTGGAQVRVEELESMAGDAPVFALSIVDGKINVRDLISASDHPIAISWRPRRVAINGLTLILLGGYFEIESFQYGDTSTATAGPPELVPSAMLDRRPVPGTGQLVLLKDGAVRYEAR